MRENEAKKNIIKKRYKTRFLTKLNIMKNVNIIIYILSNNLSYNKRFF